MSLTNCEKEVMEAIFNLSIEDRVKKYIGIEKEIELQKIKNKFVCGNPRVWWLSLKYKPMSFVFSDVEPYLRISDFFDADEEVWVVIEDEEQLLLKATVYNIVNIISECSYFEYNIISQNLDRFLCETDHGEILFIDQRKN